MSNQRKPYKTYTKEFKLEAVRLMSESDKPSSEIAAVARGQVLRYPHE